MCRDGNALIIGCVVGLVLYAGSLALFFPETTVDFGPEEGPTLMRADEELSNEEIGNDPDLPIKSTALSARRTVA